MWKQIWKYNPLDGQWQIAVDIWWNDSSKTSIDVTKGPYNPRKVTVVNTKSKQKHLQIVCLFQQFNNIRKRAKVTCIHTCYMQSDGDRQYGKDSIDKNKTDGWTYKQADWEADWQTSMLGRRQIGRLVYVGQLYIIQGNKYSWRDTVSAAKLTFRIDQDQL